MYLRLLQKLKKVVRNNGISLETKKRILLDGESLGEFKPHKTYRRKDGQKKGHLTDELVLDGRIR